MQNDLQELNTFAKSLIDQFAFGEDDMKAAVIGFSTFAQVYTSLSADRAQVGETCKRTGCVHRMCACASVRKRATWYGVHGTCSIWAKPRGAAGADAPAYELGCTKGLMMAGVSRHRFCLGQR